MMADIKHIRSMVALMAMAMLVFATGVRAQEIPLEIPLSPDDIPQPPLPDVDAVLNAGQIVLLINRGGGGTGSSHFQINRGGADEFDFDTVVGENILTTGTIGLEVGDNVNLENDGNTLDATTVLNDIHGLEVGRNEITAVRQINTGDADDNTVGVLTGVENNEIAIFASSDINAPALADAQSNGFGDDLGESENVRGRIDGNLLASLSVGNRALLNGGEVTPEALEAAEASGNSNTLFAAVEQINGAGTDIVTRTSSNRIRLGTGGAFGQDSSFLISDNVLRASGTGNLATLVPRLYGGNSLQPNIGVEYNTIQINDNLDMQTTASTNMITVGRPETPDMASRLSGAHIALRDNRITAGIFGNVLATSTETRPGN